ncbi:MAG: SIMPL domain-containing protein [Actinomycetota bacterium]
MKRETVVATASVGLLLVGVFAWAGQSAVAQDVVAKKEKRTIQTSGQGTVRIHPDHARVFFGVQTFAPTVKQARSDNAARVKQVTAALTGLKIPDLKMKSTNLTVELVHVDGDGRAPKVVGYRVTNTFTALVTSSDSEKLGPLASRALDAALENGANIVQQVVFFQEDRADAKRQALVKAVRDARENAGALAEGAGRTVTDVISIVGEPEYAFGGQVQMMNAVQSDAGGGESTSLMAGEQEVTCRVNVTCTY